MMNNFNFGEVGFSQLKPLILNQKLLFQRLGFGIRANDEGRMARPELFVIWFSLVIRAQSLVIPPVLKVLSQFWLVQIRR
jgi:hypothetical protein